MSLFLYTHNLTHTHTHTLCTLSLSTYLYHSAKEELQKCFSQHNCKLNCCKNPFSPIRRRFGPLPFENIKISTTTIMKVHNSFFIWKYLLNKKLMKSQNRDCYDNILIIIPNKISKQIFIETFLVLPPSLPNPTALSLVLRNT